MATQRITVSRKEPVVIETPLGFVRIFSAGGKKLEIQLPDGLVAHVGDERAQNNARWLEKRKEDGKTLAKYKMLMPVLAPDGSLIDLETPAVRRLAM